MIIYLNQLVSEAKRKSSDCIFKALITDSMLRCGQRLGISRHWAGTMPTTG